MAKITLKDLSHSYLKTQSSDADWAVRDVNIDWEDGGAYAYWALQVVEKQLY